MEYAAAKGAMEAVAASEQLVRRSCLLAEDSWLEFEQVTWDVSSFEVGPGEDSSIMPSVGLGRSFVEGLQHRNQPPVGIDTWVFDRQGRVVAPRCSTRRTPAGAGTGDEEEG